MTLSTIINVVFGAALIGAGRKLFWLFVAGAGFVTGLRLASIFLEDRPEWQLILVALIAGVVGAVLAVVLQRLAVAVAGFLAGGYFLLTLIELLGVEPGSLDWLVYVIGGVLGAVFVAALFDWALIALSSLAGAALVVQSLDLTRPVALLLLLAGIALGVLIQGRVYRREQRAGQLGR